MIASEYQLTLPNRLGGESNVLFKRLTLEALGKLSPIPSEDILPVLQNQELGPPVPLRETDELEKPGRFNPCVERHTFLEMDFTPDGAVPVVDQSGTPLTFQLDREIDRPWEWDEWEKVEARAREVLKAAGFREVCEWRILFREANGNWYLFEDVAEKLDTNVIDLEDFPADSSFWIVFGQSPTFRDGDLPRELMMDAGGPYGPLAWATEAARLIRYRREHVPKIARDAFEGPFPLGSETPAQATARLEWMLADAFARGWQLGSHLRGTQVHDVVNRDHRASSGPNRKATQRRRALIKDFTEKCWADGVKNKMEIARRIHKLADDPASLFWKISLLSSPEETSREVAAALKGINASA